MKYLNIEDRYLLSRGDSESPQLGSTVLLGFARSSLISVLTLLRRLGAAVDGVFHKKCHLSCCSSNKDYLSLAAAHTSHDPLMIGLIPGGCVAEGFLKRCGVDVARTWR